MSRVTVCSIALLLWCINAPVWGWAERGHQLAGERAQRQLTPEANAHTREFLRH